MAQRVSSSVFAGRSAELGELSSRDGARGRRRSRRGASRRRGGDRQEPAALRARGAGRRPTARASSGGSASSLEEAAIPLLPVADVLRELSATTATLGSRPVGSGDVAAGRLDQRAVRRRADRSSPRARPGPARARIRLEPGAARTRGRPVGGSLDARPGGLPRAPPASTSASSSSRPTAATRSLRPSLQRFLADVGSAAIVAADRAERADAGPRCGTWWRGSSEPIRRRTSSTRSSLARRAIRSSPRS